MQNKDKKLVDDFIFIVRCHYQTIYTGYDTFIDRENIKEHLINITRESIRLNGKLDAIESIIVE